MVRRRLISACLRFYREQAGINAKNAADRILSDPSKITRLEKGQRAISPRDVRDLCDAYGVPDDVRSELMTLAKNVRTREWWQATSLPAALQTLIALEGSAQTISEFEVIAIPGFLQTREYAESILSLYLARDPVKRENAVNARLRRREIYTGDSGPEIRILLDQAAITRIVGGKQIMRAQLSYLVDAIEKYGIDLRIIPFDAGAHLGISNGFTVLEIPKPEIFPAGIPNPGFVYLELSSGSSYLDDPGDVEQHLTTFSRQRNVALSVDDSVNMLRAAVKAN
jgi:transcriptional regulator with XRE-family HTH domain